MNQIKKILAPTDLSQLSKAGVLTALDLARQSGAEVMVYHVVDRNELLRYGSAWGTTGQPYRTVDILLEKYEQALSSFLTDNFSDLLPLADIRKKVELGSPDKNIVEEAKKENVDLIVMSTQGRTGLSHILVGSVTEKVVRHAPCPVLSIHPEPAEKAPQEVSVAAVEVL